MIKFLDLNTGYSFDGLWNETQSNGYIFWFPNEQSTNITYTMPIAIITDKKPNNTIHISIEENDIFKLINPSVLDYESTNVDGFDFYSNNLFTNDISVNTQFVNGNYVAIFNVSCNAKVASEYICKIYIDDIGYIKVGADIYDEYEPVYINLSNMGVEIPETIQKVFYTSNVHEDYKDNILLNRKFKELISNYWDIIANKGSYKSLLNSLEWFEWGDKLSIKEIYRTEFGGLTKFADKDIVEVMKNNIVNTASNFINTTFISLYTNIYNELNEYDSEYNPVLEKIVFDWTRDDIQLKLALLAHFFGTFFLPIHMAILQATLEDKVFTNSIKTIIGAQNNRIDTYAEYTYVKCNIKDNEIFKISNVNVTNDDFIIFPELSLTETYNQISDNDYVRYYGGPGVIIPITLTIDNMNNEFIKQTIIKVNDEQLNTFYNIFESDNGQIIIKFNYLAKKAITYKIDFSFITGSSKTLNKTINFIVEDNDNIVINVYKIKSKNDTLGFSIKDFSDFSLKHIFRIQPFNNEQHNIIINNNLNVLSLPYMTTNNSLYNDYNGIKLNRTIVSKNRLLDLIENYLEFVKYELNENGEKEYPKYYIYVSKKFYADDPIINTSGILRNDLGFYPQFHYLELLDGSNIDDYTISQYDALCCSVEIDNNESNNIKNIVELKYGHLINNTEWQFINFTNENNIIYPTSSQNPFIANNKKMLDQGYYTIKFNYRLGNELKQIISNSAFRLKYIE